MVQPGAVWLAKATGHQIVPFHAEADRHWTLGSWDRTQIPKPFARVVMAVGEPLTVAADADAAALDLAGPRPPTPLAGRRTGVPAGPVVLGLRMILLSSDHFSHHLTPPGHPERPERADALRRVARAWATAGHTLVEPSMADETALARVHDPGLHRGDS